jgi:hypothetical protein
VKEMIGIATILEELAVVAAGRGAWDIPVCDAVQNADVMPSPYRISMI